jgi:hypothetical protein
VDEKSAKSSNSSIAPDQSTLLSPEFLPRRTEGDGGARFGGVNAAADVAAAAQIA